MSALGLVKVERGRRQDLHPWVRIQLLGASAAGAPEGIPGTEAKGQLIRPLVALASVRDHAEPPAGFWQGVLAVQLAHEASLAHDDILDAAGERRGVATAAAADGVPRALLKGDHLLTAAYRAAARTGSMEFVTLFARAVERTVAGETAQGRVTGQVLVRRRYEEIALGKAGELLGCALAIAPTLEARNDVDELFELGRRAGLLYQMLDDLLDYCPLTDTGKPSMSDYAQRRWTWVLQEAQHLPFGRDPQDALQTLHGTDSVGSPMRRALNCLELKASELSAEVSRRLPHADVMRALITQWVERARGAVAREVAHHACDERRARGTAIFGVAAFRQRVPDLAGVESYLASNSRSFRFATRFFPRKDVERVARVYSYCRVTDDLVDRPPEGWPVEDLLEGWLELSRRAYSGQPSGLALVDKVMGEMADEGVPFAYAADLAAGMRMDLGGQRYGSLAELRLYTYRVASVVGLWLTRLFGVHDAEILERAARMGHAMQLTNILRDVGEDWQRGRLYLPADLLRKHGVREPDLTSMCEGGPLSTGYRDLIEELVGVAETDYAAALAALPSLPSSFARPVAVAAHVYRGIHGEIRRRGYDNLRQRAYTVPLAKGMHAARALLELHRAPRLFEGAAAR